jgi:predicted RNA-binding Zn ribbon-like protein
MKPLDSESGQWLLADPELAVDFLGTRRRRGDALADELPDDHEAAAWVREHVGRGDAGLRAELMSLRELLRGLFTAIIDGVDSPAEALETLNGLAVQAPVTLTARHGSDGIVIERTSPGAPAAVLRADIARSALALLAEPARRRLRLCRAPGCALFFLTDRPRQRWCSASCGNRARVARHYAHHQPR